MCNVLINQCSNSACKKQQRLPSKTQPCRQADIDKKNCAKPVEQLVANKDRQLCTRCNGGNELRLLKSNPANARSSSQSSTHSSVAARSESADSSGSGSGRRSTSKGKAPVPSTSEVSSKLKQTTLSDNKPFSGSFDRMQGVPACKPTDLAAEPAEWKTWRTQEPAEEDHKPDSREARYQAAYLARPDRAWPLPYESFDRYKERQMNERKRPQKDAYWLHYEWTAWRRQDPEFQPTDDSYWRRWITAVMTRSINKRRYEERLRNPPAPWVDSDEDLDIMSGLSEGNTDQ